MPEPPPLPELPPLPSVVAGPLMEAGLLVVAGPAVVAEPPPLGPFEPELPEPEPEPEPLDPLDVGAEVPTVLATVVDGAFEVVLPDEAEPKVSGGDVV